MIIDHNTAMLVSASLPEGPDQSGRYPTVFIPIQSILDLLAAEKTLVGHPWLNAPPEDIIYQPLTRHEYRRLKRYLQNGRYIAASAVAKRGRGMRAVRFDEAGEPITRYAYTWRKPEDYLTPEQIHWLQAFAEESYRFAAGFFAACAIADFIQALAAKVAQTPARRSKKKHLKAKERRRLRQMFARERVEEEEALP